MTAPSEPTARRTQQAKRRPLLLAGGLFAAAVGISTLLFLSAPSATVEVPDEKIWPVTTMPVEPRALAPSFSAFGRVEARHRAELAAELSHPVARIAVREGDRVRAGDLLIALDDAELKLEEVAARAALTERRAELKRYELELEHLKAIDRQQQSRAEAAAAKLKRHDQLREQRLIAQGLYDEVLQQASEARIQFEAHRSELKALPHRLTAARAAVEEASSGLARAELRRRKAELRAPFDGLVLSVDTAVGAIPASLSPLITLADQDSYQVRVAVPPAHQRAFLDAATQLEAPSQISATLKRLRLGSARSDGSATRVQFSRLAGSVASGSPTADALFEFVTDRGNEVLGLPLGATLELQVVLPALRGAIAVPPEALYENARVYQVIDDRLNPVTVEPLGDHLGPDGLRVLIQSDRLTSGAEIIVTQLPNPIAGQKVRLVQPDAATIAGDQHEALPLSASEANWPTVQNFRQDTPADGAEQPLKAA